jgi:two-component system response regulator YesN
MVSLAQDEFPGMVFYETTYQMHYYMTVVCPVASEQIQKQYVLDKSASFGRKLRYYFSVTLKGGISLAQGRDIPRLLAQAELARQKCFFGQ